MKHTLVARPAIGTALILVVPLVMTHVDRNKPEGDGWRWSSMDFLVMGVLLFGAGLAYESFSRRVVQKGHKVLLGFAVFCVVLLIWVELAVGGASQLLSVFG